MQNLASNPHLTQSMDPTHHSVIEPNPTYNSCQKNSTKPDPTQPNPWMDPTHVNL